MIKNFDDTEAEAIHKGKISKKLPQTIQNIARRKLRMLEAAKVIEDLRIPPGNHLEKLHGNLEGFYSVRVNDQWRVVFKFENGDVENVRITDYH